MPTTLTADQAEQIAHALLDCADSIDRRLVTDWKSMDSATREQLMDLAQQMRAKATLLVNVAVGMILDQAKDAFAQITSAASAGETALQNIQTLNRAINVATALIALGAAVASKDPIASVQAATNVFDQIA